MFPVSIFVVFPEKRQILPDFLPESFCFFTVFKVQISGPQFSS